jgi:hypothetical protein
VEVMNAPGPPVAWQGLLGYLNFSDGRADSRFEQQFHAACLEVGNSKDLCGALAGRLRAELKALHDSGSAAFRETSQAEFAIRAAFEELPLAYLRFHADLLGHHPPESLLTPFFLLRISETVLQQRKLTNADEVTNGFIDDTLARLNDYVGYRPVPVLETRAAIDFYPHEKIRPVPLYIKGVGVAAGPYQQVVLQALQVLSDAPRDLLDEAHLDLSALEEIAFDPRAYDHNHPANRRPNYVFGEWDPHHIDGQGRYTRFVVRQTILDLLLRRIAEGRTLQFKLDPKTKNYFAEFSVPWDDSERIFESAAVLAGTTLMATMLCGAAPTAHDSSSTLSNLVPRIAKLRDEFYQRLIDGLDGPRAEQLRQDAAKTRQPFGGVRQSLNQSLAQDRATHLQERQLAVLFAILGFTDESRARATKVAAPGVRFVIESRVRLTEAVSAVEKGELNEALRLLNETVDVVKRGIDCGAIVDPWNILGFQGLYPLFQSREDSVHDPRVEELMTIMEDLFDGYSAVVMEAAAKGEPAVRGRALDSMRHLADWWDRFATHEVSDVKRVHGGDAVESADHVADALARWRQAGGAAAFAGPTGSVNFWRDHLEGFRTPAAFGRVVAALLDRGDLPASMALLMTWLNQTPDMQLGEGDFSFHALARRWVRSAGRHVEAQKLLGRFFELLEANADSFWYVPDLETMGVQKSEKQDDRFEAAYEGMTFRDSADDGGDGALLGDEADREPFSLDEQAEPLRQRIQFLATIADLLQETGAVITGRVPPAWKKLAADRAKQLQSLLEPLHDVTLPAPDTASFESSVEYDRRREIKESLIDETIAAAVSFRQASRSLGVTTSSSTAKPMFAWEAAGAALEQEIRRGDVEAVKQKLNAFTRSFSDEPLLYIPVGQGGHPRQVLRARAAQSMIHSLLDRLPRLGLFRETFNLIHLTRKMEQNAPPEGRRVTEFDRLFPVGLRGSIETLIDAIEDEADPPQAAWIQEKLNALTRPYLTLWLKHSQSLRLSVIEPVQNAADWLQIEKFVERFGRQLFTAQTLNLANLRAILHRGIDDWLEQLPNQDDAPEEFLAALEGDVSKAQARQLLEVILQAVAENYDEYRDYNTTTTQSDYGNNLFLLLDFLRLKVAYERDNWRLRPLLLTHEVLCRRSRTGDAARWQELISVYTRTQSEQHLQELVRLEAKHAIRLRTIRERLEERFVSGLAQDRLAALLPPLWESARKQNADAPERLKGFLAAVEPFTAHPVGAGLETPGWIRRLEREMARIRSEELEIPQPIPTRPTLAQLTKQLTGDWEERLELP